jgi:hypothetical protein
VLDKPAAEPPYQLFELVLSVNLELAAADPLPVSLVDEYKVLVSLLNPNQAAEALVDTSPLTTIIKSV